MVSKISMQLTVQNVLLIIGLASVLLWWRDDVVLGKRHRTTLQEKDDRISEITKDNKFLQETVVKLYEAQMKLIKHMRGEKE